MNKSQKVKLLNEAKEHIKHVQTSIGQVLISAKKAAEEALLRMRSVSRYEDKVICAHIIEARTKRVKELTNLKPSPYFTRCDVKFADEKEKRSIYLGKFNFDDEKIYSWLTPVATIRFEKPGKFSYEKPGGGVRNGRLFRKDQYMIVDGKIVFLSTESIDSDRELVYQDYFSSQKTEFALPEVVAQMEKAQDQVIRAHHVGPMIITGPAGSGKTTLALHRVAYLAQSPETSALYQEESIIVFVQDEGTKEYFSQLLPRLGIDNVVITTFAQWAMDILEANDIEYVLAYGESEQEKDLLGYQKLQALRNAEIPGFRKGSLFDILRKTYTLFFGTDYLRLFDKQCKDRQLDYFDLSVLLTSYLKTFGELKVTREYYANKIGRAIKRIGKFPLDYSLVIVDEFQNYLPEQLTLMRCCNKKDKKSVVYVGDIGQQVRLGTIKDLAQIDEIIEEDRQIVLQKVYRNTKNILKYIKSIGYDIQIPDKIRMGETVVEKICADQNEEIAHIEKVIVDLKLEKASIGIIAKNAEYLKGFKKAFKNNNNIRFYSMEEVQGVEFDTVFIVGINDSVFKFNYGDEGYALLEQEKKRINRDLLYVALTRAVNRLHILGQKSLEDSAVCLFE